jgi:hypothetical protein
LPKKKKKKGTRHSAADFKQRGSLLSLRKASGEKIQAKLYPSRFSSCNADRNEEISKGITYP